MSEREPACWDKDRSLVMYRLEDLDTNLERIREEQIQTRIDISVQKAATVAHGELSKAAAARAGIIYGAVTAGLISVIDGIIRYFVTK